MHDPAMDMAIGLSIKFCSVLPQRNVSPIIPLAQLHLFHVREIRKFRRLSNLGQIPVLKK